MNKRLMNDSGIALEDIRKAERSRSIVLLKSLVRDLQYAKSEDEEDMIAKEIRSTAKKFRNGK